MYASRYLYSRVISPLLAINTAQRKPFSYFDLGARARLFAVLALAFKRAGERERESEWLLNKPRFIDSKLSICSAETLFSFVVDFTPRQRTTDVARDDEERRAARVRAGAFQNGL